MSRILLIGPGDKRSRAAGLDGPNFGTVFSENIYVLDYKQEALDKWKDVAQRTFKIDLNSPPYNLPELFFDEIHAYEVVNLLSVDFFSFWKRMWAALAPKGKFIGTVPHWKSRWIHAYPYRQKVYTAELLAHLNQLPTLAAQEPFTKEWPKPYCFHLVQAYDICSNSGEPQGFTFVLEKNSCS